MYRGRFLVRPVLLPMMVDTTQSVKPRVAVATWNVDGLSGPLFAEIRKWLREHDDIGALLVQERMV